MSHNSPQRSQIPGKIWGYAWRGCFVLVLFYIFGPFLIALLYVNNQGGEHRSSCSSNMKQLGLALVQYEQDSDNQLPPPLQAANKQTWREAIFPFVKSTGVYECPDDPPKASPFTQENLPQSYAANRINWGKLGNESQRIMVVDVRGDNAPDWDMTSPAFAPPSSRILYTHKLIHLFYERPLGTLNCLFADGHVKAMYLETTMTPINLWTRDNTPFAGQDLTNAQAILRHSEQE